MGRYRERLYANWVKDYVPTLCHQHVTAYSPPSLSRLWQAVIGLFLVLLIGYALIIVHQPILGTFPVILLGFLYLGWRFLVATEAIADALQRLAHQRERE